MSTIIKMMVSIIAISLKIAWRITKIVCGPMWDSIKSLCKASWEFYKAKEAQKAASAGDAAESANPPADGVSESKDNAGVESPDNNA